MTLSVKSIGNGGYQTSIEDDRMLTAALTSKETGLMTPTDFVATPSAPAAGFALHLTAGAMLINGSASTSQGSYFVWSDVAADIAWTPASTLPRIDSLLMVVADGQYGTPTVANGPQWVVATGTPNASPVALSDAEIAASWAQPGAWVRVYDLDVAASQTVFLTNQIHQKLFTVQSRRILSYIHEPTTGWPTDGNYITTTERIIGAAPGAAPVTLRKTFTVKAGRCYRVRMTSLTDADGSGNPSGPTTEVRLRYASGTTVSTTSTQFGAGRALAASTTGANNPSIDAEGYLNNLTAGTYTVGAFLIASAAGVGVRLFSPFHMTIEDVGPAADETYS